MISDVQSVSTPHLYLWACGLCSLGRRDPVVIEHPSGSLCVPATAPILPVALRRSPALDGRENKQRWSHHAHLRSPTAHDAPHPATFTALPQAASSCTKEQMSGSTHSTRCRCAAHARARAYCTSLKDCEPSGPRYVHIRCARPPEGEFLRAHATGRPSHIVSGVAFALRPPQLLTASSSLVAFGLLACKVCESLLPSPATRHGSRARAWP